MIDIFLIVTRKYHQFAPEMIASIKKHFKIPYRLIIFTDEPKYPDHTEVIIKHEPFPYITLFRYHYFTQVRDLIKNPYVFYVDIDAKFVQDVGEEILGDLVAVRHCGFFFAKMFPHEENPLSPLYNYRFTKYYGGGFQGGKAENYFKMAEWCKEKIDHALDLGLQPETEAQKYSWNKRVALRHHDETAMNAYLSFNPPTLELTPDFHYPQNFEWFRLNCWEGNMPFTPKLLLLDKDHHEVRS